MLQTCMKSDVWSLGVIMFIMLIGKMPFGGVSKEQILKNVMTQELSFDHPNFVHVSKEAKDLISRMLDRNVETRIDSN